MVGEGRKRIVLAPVGITHIASDLADLVRVRAAGRDRIEVNTSAQPNSHPHLGSITTLATAFAMAEHLQRALGLPAHLTFDALENSPGQSKDTPAGIMQMSLSDTPITTGDGQATTKERRFMGSFEILLGHFSAQTGVPYTVRPYREFGLIPEFRAALIAMLRDREGFAPIVSPSERRVHIRFACPFCGWAEKSCSTLRVSDVGSHLDLSMICPEHGDYGARLAPDGGDLIDTGTAVREVGKAAVLAAEGRPRNALVVVVDGSDWTGNWALMVFVAGALRLGLSFEDLAERFYTPAIVDWSGGKFSKSVYVRGGEYDELPEAYLNFQVFNEVYGEAGLDALLVEAQSWVNDPRRMIRNYSLEYLRELLPRP